MNNLIDIQPCELISKFWKKTHYWQDESINNWTPEQIFNYSPTGELFRVCQWYREAQLYYKMIKCDYCDSYDIEQTNVDWVNGYSFRCNKHKLND